MAWLDALELAQTRAGASLASLRALRRGATQPSHFRGRRCHCPPGLARHYVHSEALREACDFVIDFDGNVPHPERRPWPVPALARLAAQLPHGASVYVKGDLLDAFTEHVLPELRHAVVLVTGDSDVGFCARHAALLSHPRVAHVWAQNCELDLEHPRLSRLPIGLDNPVYLKPDKRVGFALAMLAGKMPFDPTFSRNDIGDQACLQRIAAKLPPNRQRSPRALCTFHQNEKLIAPDLSRLPERAEACLLLRDNPACHFVPRRLKQAECWQLHGDYAFQVSPRGNGLDCFRTWESLALGVIPIVKRSALARLFAQEELPVLVLDAWSELTPARLADEHPRLTSRFDDELLERLSADHFIAKVRAAQAEALR